MTLDLALHWARLRFGRRVHVIDGGRRATFVDLDEEATRLAGRLRADGLRRGERAALELANGLGSLAAAFAIWRAGGVLVPLNPRLAPAEKDAIAERSGARLRVGFADAGEEPAIAAGPEPGPPDDAALAAIAYTSGTTGRPKGVEITHSNVLWSAAAVMHTRRDGPQAVAAMVSPISHLPVFVSHYVARLLSGGTVVAGSFDPDLLPRLVVEHGITDLPLVPAMVAPLLERGMPPGAIVRKVTVGSAVTSMEVKRALAERFAGAEVLEAYGLTESTDGLTMTVGREALERPGTVGRAHALVPVAIAGPEGRPVAPGSRGEIVCQGPTVMRGYRGEPEATAEALRGGWLHTGDLGKMDEDGYVYVTGRRKDVIITGGENVSPEEVEGVLATHPAVVEAAVFGRRDPRWGERIAAAVVARSAVTAEQLSEHVARRLARFKRPREVFFVESLPKTAAGKVRRSELRERYDTADEGSRRS